MASNRKPTIEEQKWIVMAIRLQRSSLISGSEELRELAKQTIIKDLIKEYDLQRETAQKWYIDCLEKADL